MKTASQLTGEPNPEMNIVIRGFDGVSWIKGMMKSGLNYSFDVGVCHHNIPDDQLRKAVRVLMTDMFKFYNVTTEIAPTFSQIGFITLTKTWFGSTYTITNITKPVLTAKLSYIKITGKV